MQLVDAAIDSPMDWNEATLEMEDFPQVIGYHGPTCNYQSDCAQAGTSRSICGLVALNCARLALKLDAEDSEMESFPRRLISKAMVNEMMAIANLNDLKVENHLDIEELLEIPIFEETFVAKPTTDDVQSVDDLKNILSNCFPDTSTKVRVAVFSSNAEVVVCLKFPHNEACLYGLYDSHIRRNHRDGPAFTLSGDLDEFSNILHQILFQSISDTPSSDKFSAYVLEPKVDAHKRDIHHLLARSAVYLSRKQMASDATHTGQPFSEYDHLSLLRARAETLRKMRSQEFPDSQPTTASSKSEHSRGKKPSTEPRHRGEFGWQLSLLNPTPVSTNSGNHEDGQKPTIIASSDSSYDISNKENIPPPSGLSRASEYNWLTSFVQGSTEQEKDDTVPSLPPKEDPPLKSVLTHGRSGEFGWQLALQQQTGNGTGIESGEAASSKAALSGQQSPDIVKDSDTWETALLQQLQEEEEITASLSNHVSGEHAWLVALQKRVQNGENSESKGAGSSSLSRSELDWQLAVQLQQEVYRDEGFGPVKEPSPRIVVECDEDGDMVADAPPSYSRNKNYLHVPAWRGSEDTSTFNTLDIPSQSSSQQFECGVCGEMHNATEKLSLTECGHNFCKECLTTFTKTKIEEGRYPIFCPECLAQRLRNSRSQVTPDIVEKLNITKDELQRLEELQLVAHSITLECPRCKESMNVDREQYGEQSVIICPLPRCGHRWCKSCLKTLASSEENHRCKNGNIDRLMRKKGWKYCPGCRTPVQKESGCNHMTCGAPGCNVHFCYKCGVLMIDTTNGGDVGTAVTEHYLNCRLFEKRLKCTIQ